ncbi:TapY2 family type IVa secretion system protein [Gallaecimonas sp. GXIMD1310]|uniref:TapY2 family type IVa secretion system protein n=1 Tax=Gallaecimonas sp. GXIMD1310 TaxID=3131926 RepID=UPI00324F1B64
MGVGKLMFAAAAVVISAGAQAKSVEYKCYLQLNGKQEKIVHFIKRSEEQAKALVFGLPHTKLDWPGKPVITKVFECVSVKTAFHSARARALEAKAPR